jgi:uncharacterized protein with gpF-like domain
MWLSSRDSKVRPDHAAADGQTRPVGLPFTVGGVELMYPGDPVGPPGEVVNCRCTMLFEVSRR